MKVFYCDEFVLPLPSGHRFPMDKYRLLREHLLVERIVEPDWLEVPPPATDEQILRVHTADYLGRVVGGALGPAEVRRLGFPWSPQLVERSRRSVGGTIGAARAALSSGAAVNLAGGTHHATAERGAGFCVLNDVAIAARELQAHGLARRVLVVDCDVHQGDGTAAIFRDDPSVFSFSIHGCNNYPYHKEPGDLDVALEDGSGDEEYLRRLGAGLDESMSRSRPDVAFYIAGADPLASDRWGRLALSHDGLARRDGLVLRRLGLAGVPVAVVMGGGYAPDVTDIVAAHAQTVRLASDLATRSVPIHHAQRQETQAPHDSPVGGRESGGSR